MHPLISVCIQTYHHVHFIRKCIDGILSQVTNFSFEILLGEDDSTDGTRDICIEYAEKYPDKIRLFLHDRKDNIRINGRPSGRFNLLNNLSNVQGKYFAICEGDDFWADREKLQRQVEILENRPDYAICFHGMKILEEEGLTDSFIADEHAGSTGITDLAKENYIYTASALYRNHLPETLPEFFRRVPFLDYVLHLYIAQYGKIKYIPERMAVYRVHPGGIWSGMSTDTRLESQLQVIDNLIKYFTDNESVLHPLNLQRLDVILKLIVLCHQTTESSKADLYVASLGNIDPGVLAEYLTNIQDRYERLNRKFWRVTDHPVSGRVIRLLAKIKRDPDFGKSKF